MTREQRQNADEERYKKYLEYQRKYQKERRNQTTKYLDNIRVKEYNKAKKDLILDLTDVIIDLNLPSKYEDKILNALDTFRKEDV